MKHRFRFLLRTGAICIIILSAVTAALSYGQQAPVQKPGTLILHPKDIEAGKLLIIQSDCKTCHLADQTLIGPGYKEVAQRYPATEATVQYLSKKIISGGGGVWGENEMSAHNTLTADHTRKIVLYILSLK